MQLYLLAHPEAFDHIYSRHSGRLYAFLLKKVPKESAEDLLQDTFVKLHKHKHTYKADYLFLPWLFTIAHNTLRDHFKKNEMHIQQHSQELMDTHIATGDPEDKDINPWLDSLPSQQRHIFELRYLKDWSFEQIAQETQKTPSNIRQLISRGLKKLKSQNIKDHL